ncbi:hypothetical protein F4779DRAFT_579783 [Xylariaceae sp. FL0662B]|nr:hypothetical protein F4779DRAFT_579783 [Xylariaceae sp. FL0662B]
MATSNNLNPIAALPQTFALHWEILLIIHRPDRAPTPCEYGAALEMADAAMDIAVDAGLDAAAIAKCRGYQHLCHSYLCFAYAQNEECERIAYGRRSSSEGAHRPASPSSELSNKPVEGQPASRKVHFPDELGRRVLANIPAGRRVHFAELVRPCCSRGPSAYSRETQRACRLSEERAGSERRKSV